VVDGDPRRRRRWCGEVARPASMTDDSISNSVLEEEAMTTSLSPGLGGDGSGSSVAGHGKESSGLLSRGGDGCVVVSREERGSSGDAHAQDKDGWSTWNDGDRRCMFTTTSLCVVSRAHML
jgi:hypothetical protein